MVRIRAALLILLITFTPTLGHSQSGTHGDGHAAGHDWYRNLKQPRSGGSCCNEQTTLLDGTTAGDCRPVRAYLDEDRNTYRAKIGDRWVDVPWFSVLRPELNQDPLKRAVICAAPDGRIFCFLDGQPNG